MPNTETVRLQDRVSFLYFEHGTLGVAGNSLNWKSSKQEVTIPSQKTACLLIGPGSNVTHAAMKLCAESNTLVQWVGDTGTRLYSAGHPLQGNCERIMDQAYYARSEKHRLRVARHMFNRRFGQKLAAFVTPVEMMGLEGARVKQIYHDLAKKHAVVWIRRDVKGSDDLNRIINTANGHLFQAATISVLAAGFHPAIGFVHSGFDRAFVADITDLHKFEVTVPLAFQLYAKGITGEKLYTEVRHAVRQELTDKNLIHTMIQDSIEVVSAGNSSS